MFKRIDHVELVTDRPERIEAFYTDVLGFRVKARDRIETSSRGAPMNLAYLELGGSVVEIISYEGAAYESTSAAPAAAAERRGWRMIALEVENMQRAIDHLRGKGVAVAWGPRVRESYARAEIRDPDGNPIELREWFR
ncbi:MAG TPA: VOC family protein [Stellaceae bacterium]|nr:VOC family protein [Stellaceae bacterium]